MVYIFNNFKKRPKWFAPRPRFKSRDDSRAGYSDVSNNRTGTAIYFQKMILPDALIRDMFFKDNWNIVNLYAYSLRKICHPVRLLKTVRLLEISE